MKLLVTGGSGYLGQYLVRYLSEKHQVSYTYNRQPLPETELLSGHSVSSFKVDFSSGEGLKECLEATQGLDVIVNCAAISQTGRCQSEQELATKINVPTFLLEELQMVYPQNTRQPLLVHLSSDQREVYDGNKAYWKESDPCCPVNHYGKTKVESEELIKKAWSSYVILRSSLIYGARLSEVSGDPKFLDFLVESLRSGKQTSFFSDEYRNPIYVQDIVKIVEHFTQQRDEGKSFCHTFNMGGPNRLSRVDMAYQVAHQLGIRDPAIEEVKSADIARKVPSPLDISMNCQALIHELPFELTPFSVALTQIYPNQ